MHGESSSRIPPLLLGLLLCAVSAGGENWPHWRGPRLDGTSAETGLPATWSRDDNVRWRLPLPGPAGSTPVVWGERVFLTSTDRESEALSVLAVSRGGKVLWRREVDWSSQRVSPQFAVETTLASPSPVTDGRRLWALFGSAMLVCLDLDGEVVWQRDLAALYGRPKTYFGLSSSPLLHGGRLFLQLLHTDRQLVLALDPETGEEVWAHQRATDARDECLHAYTSPTVYRAPGDGGELLLIHGADYLTAHRLGDGAEAWRHGGLNPRDAYNPSLRLVATPVAVDGLVIVPSAKRGPVYGLRPAGAKGDITGAERFTAWSRERGTPDVPSPLVHGGLVYLAAEDGKLTVLDAASGEQVYAERVHQSTHRASPVLADGKLLLTATDGTVSVVKPGRAFEILSKNTAVADRDPPSHPVFRGAHFTGLGRTHGLGGLVGSDRVPRRWPIRTETELRTPFWKSRMLSEPP